MNMIVKMFATQDCLNELLLLVNEQFKGSVQIKSSYSNGDITIDIDFDKSAYKAINSLFSSYEHCIYAYSNKSLECVLIELLKKYNFKIATAESFTGGGIASRLTAISGASQVFYEGIVCYDQLSKSRRLDIDMPVIEKYNVVSSQVALAMCEGLFESGKINFAISTTGIAGPCSHDENMPVGLCFIGIKSCESCQATAFNFVGTRQEITCQGVNAGLFLAIKQVENRISKIKTVF